MSVSLTLSGHEHDLGGGFIVRRLLPAALRQSVGPFLFLDHFGPTTILPETENDVRPHPHIGLATVSYLYEGAIMHRDSLGSEQRIEPGDINWMTAGSGIVHSERRPDSLRGQSYRLHGIQLWAALPVDKEEIAPSFSHTAAARLPRLQVEDAVVRVLIGTAFGKTSPVQAFSSTLYLDVQLPENGCITLPPLTPEMAIYAIDADLQLGDATLARHTLNVLTPDTENRLRANAATRFIVLGGEPLESKRLIWWNFVSSRQERITQAAEDWQAQRMGTVSGDPEFIPLPPLKKAP